MTVKPELNGSNWYKYYTIDNVKYFVLCDRPDEGSSENNCWWQVILTLKMTSAQVVETSVLFKTTLTWMITQDKLVILQTSNHEQRQVFLAYFDCFFFNLLPYCLLDNSWKLYPSPFNFVCRLTTLELLIVFIWMCTFGMPHSWYRS